MQYAGYILSALAIIVMAVDLFKAFQLKAALARGEMGGGEIARKWSLLSALLVFFFAGYLVSPLLLIFELNPRYVSILVFLVFFLGAGFVFIVIGIVRDVLSFLGLLK